MRDALEAKKEIGERISKAKRVVLFLDFDGTLAPIVTKPDLAQMSEKTRAFVTACARRFETYIVTGRPLDNIRKRAAIRGLGYSGSHGVEYFLNGNAGMVRLSKGALRDLKAARVALTPVALDHKGALLEYKGGGLAFHYRLAKRKEATKKDALKALASIKARGHVRIQDSKMALDVLPDSHDKGDFIRMIMKKKPKGTVAIYIGDDTSDEHAFKALPRQITVRVGKTKTAAAYYLSSQKEVAKLLRSLLAA